MKKITAAILLLTLCLLAACGGTPTPDVTPTPDAPQTDIDPTPTPEATDAPVYIERPTLSEPSGVFTDWSKLTEYTAATEIYTRLSDAPLTEFTPADYGLLLPFEGERSIAKDYGGYVGSKYGLVTAEGCIVLDAVCESISRGDFWSPDGVEYLDFYIMERMVYDPTNEYANEYNGGYFSVYGACATDGSWFTGFRYDGIYSMPEGLLCIIDGRENLAVAYDVEGKLLFDTADWPVREMLSEWSVYNISQLSSETKWVNVALLGVEDPDAWEYGYINARGELLETEAEGRFERAQAFSDGLAAVCVDGLWGYIDESGDWAVEPRWDMGCDLSSFSNGKALVSKSGSCALIDRSGAVLKSMDERIWQISSGETVIYCGDTSDGGICYYDENLEPIYLGGRAATSCTNDGVWVEVGEDVIFRRVDGEELLFRGADYVLSYGGYTPCFVASNAEGSYSVYDWDGELIFSVDEALWVQVAQDAVTREYYIFVEKNGYTVYDMTGQKLLTGCASPFPAGGLFPCADSSSIGYKNAQNEWVFRIRLDLGD